MEKQPSLTEFYCNPDDYKSIFSKKKQAFENLEYELKVENMLNNYQAPPEDFVKNCSFFSFFSKSNLNISSYDPPKLISHLKVSNKVKRRIESDNSLAMLERFIYNHILIGEDVWKKIHPEPIFSLSNIEVPEVWEVNIPRKPWEFIS